MQILQLSKGVELCLRRVRREVQTSKPPPPSWEYGPQSKAESWIWTSNHLLSISELHFSIISVNKTSCLCCDEAQSRRDPVLMLPAVSPWLVTSLWVILWTLKTESSLLRKGKEFLNSLLNKICPKVLTTWWLVIVLFRTEKNQETSDTAVPSHVFVKNDGSIGQPPNFTDERPSTNERYKFQTDNGYWQQTQWFP